MSPSEELDRILNALALELPPTVHADASARIRALFQQTAAPAALSAPRTPEPMEPPRCDETPTVDWNALHPAVRAVKLIWWDASGHREALVLRPTLPGITAALGGAEGRQE